MGLVLLPISPFAILAICIMVGMLIIARVKKWMITYGLILANIIIFVLILVNYGDLIGDVNYYSTDGVHITSIEIVKVGLGFRAVYLTPEYAPQLYTLFTSMFIHSGFAHIFGNMLVFLFIGIAFEQRVGWKKFLAIYMLSGFCAALTQSLFNLDFPNNYTTLIGASGAIFGIMGAFAFSYPRDEVVMPIPIGIMMIFRRIKVVYAVILFALLETVIVMIGVKDNTAHFAHLGGMIGGFVLAGILLKGKQTHDKRGNTIYYDSYLAQKPKKINISNLKKLATTSELKEILKKIENEKVPQVRDIWLEHFLEKAMCPKCGHSLNHFEGVVWCENCDYRTNY